MSRIVIRTSRISFLHIYVFSLLLTGLFFLLDLHRISIYVNAAFAFFIFSLATYPEYYVFYYTFIVDKDRVIQISGFIQKRKIVIPITSVAHISLNKTLLGRILNYGDVFVVAFADTKIVLRGVKRPEELSDKLEIMMEKYRHPEEKKS